ncbi:MAG TPA: hypothetical protein VMW27_03345 [Thermoanaerobaculia bacterium]|nr:hypothetical protein [Thermoanaerobaculia bacterium]
MFNIQKVIDSGFPWLFTVCILPLCLIVPALGTAASSANPSARNDDRLLPSISSLVDQPEILVPKPPPPPPPSE